MASTKILATIFAIVALVKIALIISRSDSWMEIVKIFIENYVRTTVIYLILAAIVGYYVLTAINILDVAAVMLFTSLLTGVTCPQ